jgi:mono/diheme cytochrome c family protein
MESIKSNGDKIRTRGAGRVVMGAMLIFLGLSGCQQEMAKQPRYEPLDRSEFFDDQRAARPLVEGTVARGFLREDEHLYRGLVDGKPAAAFPFPIDKAALLRGRERYNIFCAPCHDQIGTGQGMIVRRGYQAPPSFHSDRLRQTEAGMFFQHITHGLRAMPDYAQQISPEDRWAIIAYIRALQLSQNARLSELPEAERRALESQK